MEADIAQGKIGQVGDYDLEFKDGKLQGKAKAVAKNEQFGLEAEVDLTVSLSAHAVFAALKKAIPGQVDDAVLGVIEAALIGS
jgi:hypothetical protein